MKVAIVGLGYVGFPLASSAANSGFEVIGIDKSAKRIENLRSSIDSQGIKFTSDFTSISFCKVIVICVPTPLTSDFKPDLSVLGEACREVASNVSPNSLVIVESTSYIGSLRNFVAPIFEEVSKEVELSVAPERIDPGNSYWEIRNTPRVIGALSIEALRRTQEFYSNFVDNLILAGTAEEAEAAKLLENSYRLLNIAFVQEFESELSQLGISFANVNAAASSKPFGFQAFSPGIGAGGHCIPIDPVYLTHSMLNEGSFPILKQALDQNRSRPNQVFQRIKSAINSYGIKSPKIQVLGLTYKMDAADLRESSAVKIFQYINHEYAGVTWFDPFIEEFLGLPRSEINLSNDFLIILVDHSYFKDINLKNYNGVLLNCSSGNPVKVN